MLSTIMLIGTDETVLPATFPVIMGPVTYKLGKYINLFSPEK